LLKHKSNPNIKDIAGSNRYDYLYVIIGEPLNYAIMEGQTNSVQALLENNSTDLTTTDIYGDTLMYEY